MGDGDGEAQHELSFADAYDSIVLNCFRYLDIRRLADVEAMTLREYRLLMKAAELRRVDADYRNHLQAYLNFSVRAERKAGKHKTKPVYDRFKKFYDYKAEQDKVLNRCRKRKRRYDGIERFLKDC